jgi:hypothetical protein
MPTIFPPHRSAEKAGGVVTSVADPVYHVFKLADISSRMFRSPQSPVSRQDLCKVEGIAFGFFSECFGHVQRPVPRRLRWATASCASVRGKAPRTGSRAKVCWGSAAYPRFGIPFARFASAVLAALSAHACFVSFGHVVKQALRGFPSYRC